AAEGSDAAAVLRKRPKVSHQEMVRTGFRIWAERGVQPPLPLGRMGLIITGVARGGTSFAASVCHHLGVNLGRGAPRYEDRKLARLLLAGEHERLWNRVALPRDAVTSHGWKLPALNYHLDAVAENLPDARFIFILRDPVATSLRKQVSEKTRGDPMQDTQNIIRANDRMCAFARNARRPCLLLSYEKGLVSPLDTIRDVAEFVGREVTANAAEALAEAIQADQQHYRAMAANNAADEGG
ncbi:MAG: sulfotransferase, partial [Roseococcus sp.]